MPTLELPIMPSLVFAALSVESIWPDPGELLARESVLKLFTGRIS